MKTLDSYQAHLQGYFGWKERFHPAWEVLIPSGQSQPPHHSLLSLQFGLQHHHHHQRAGAPIRAAASPGLPSAVLHPLRCLQRMKPPHEPLTRHLGRFMYRTGLPPPLGGGILVPF